MRSPPTVLVIVVVMMTVMVVLVVSDSNNTVRPEIVTVLEMHLESSFHLRTRR